MLYGSKNFKNSYTYALKYYLEFIVVVLYLRDKLKTRNEKCLLVNIFIIFKLFICQQYNNGLKQLPFDGKTVKSRIKKFTNAKLLSELPFFEKP